MIAWRGGNDRAASRGGEGPAGRTRGIRMGVGELRRGGNQNRDKEEEEDRRRDKPPAAGFRAPSAVAAVAAVVASRPVALRRGCRPA